MKEYKKPEFHYESFVMSRHIATCQFQIMLTNQDIHSCTGDFNMTEDPDFTVKLFTSEAHCVNIPGQEGTLFEEYCYTGGQSSLFNS